METEKRVVIRVSSNEIRRYVYFNKYCIDTLEDNAKLLAVWLDTPRRREMNSYACVLTGRVLRDAKRRMETYLSAFDPSDDHPMSKELPLGIDVMDVPDSLNAARSENTGEISLIAFSSHSAITSMNSSEGDEGIAIDSDQVASLRSSEAIHRSLLLELFS